MDERKIFFIFVIFFFFLFAYVQTSTERPAVLLLDIRDSHLSIAALYCIKDNGVTVLSFRLTLAA